MPTPVTSYQAITSVIYSVFTTTAAFSENGSQGSSSIVSVATVISTAVYYSTLTPVNSETVPATSAAPIAKVNSFWDSKAKVIGTFLPVALLLFLLLLLLIWILIRLRKKRNGYQDDELQHFHSDVSSAGSILGGHGATSFVYTDEKGILPSPDSNGARVSALASQATMGGGTLCSNSLPASRESKADALVFDQRLDPSHVMSQWENGGSRVSLADDVDYTRKVLRVINE